MVSNPADTLAPGNRRNLTAALLCFIAMLVIGDIDYLTGYRVSLLAFYILPVGLATVYVGPIYALVLAALSIAISIATDFWAGMPAADAPVKYWEGSVSLIVFIVAIGLLYTLKRIRDR